MLQLPVTVSGNSDVDITIGGVVYNLYYKYNSRNKRLFVTISVNDVVIVSEIRLFENSKPVELYRYLNLPEGEMLVSQLSYSTDFATIGNIGIDNDFSLMFITDQELSDAGIT